MWTVESSVELRRDIGPWFAQLNQFERIQGTEPVTRMRREAGTVRLPDH